MQARFELIQKLKDEVRDKMAEMIKDQNVYRNLLKTLIIQVMQNIYFAGHDQAAGTSHRHHVP